jgi:integrase
VSLGCSCSPRFACSQIKLCPQCAPEIAGHTATSVRPMKKPLTDTLIRSIAPPASGRVEFSDECCSGLTFRVTANGVRSWSFRFRDPRSNRLTRATLGTYPALSLGEAREKAIDVRRSVAKGANPVEEKRREREQAMSRTFGALAERYLKEHARRFKKTAEADERALSVHILPKWQARSYHSIGRRDVIELCEGILASGKPIQANRVQALVSKMFSFAVDADLLPANPCLRLRKRASEEARRRVLSDAEIALFWHRIIEKPVSRRIGLALRLVLLTGVHVTEMAGAELSEFTRLDENQSTWLIPPVRSKNGRAHVVPLSSMARAIVKELAHIADSRAEALEKREGKAAATRFLLASPAGDGQPIDGHALSVAMARFGKAFDLESKDDAQELEADHAKAAATWIEDRPTAHDLRRTLATRLAALGVPAEDVKACLNHVRDDVTSRHYDQYDRLPREAPRTRIMG